MIGDVVIDPQMKDHVLSWAEPFMVVVRRLEPAVKLLVQWDHVMGLCNRFESTTSPLQTHPRCPQFQIPVVVERKPATRVRTRQTRCLLVGRVYGVSLRDRAVSSAETPAYAGLSPFRAPYAECSIMPSTRLYASVRRATSCARLGIIQDRFRIIQELSRLAILAAGDNNNALPIRERCQLMVAQL